MSWLQAKTLYEMLIKVTWLAKEEDSTNTKQRAEVKVICGKEIICEKYGFEYLNNLFTI